MTLDELEVRKIITITEEVEVVYGNKVNDTSRKVASILVIKNPFASIYVENLSLLFDYGETIAKILVENALKALNITQEQARETVEGYGKAAIVGINGEIEHPHAILHPKFGAPIRKALGGIDYCKAIIPSNSKIGIPGTAVDIPIVNKRAIWVVSSFDTMTISIPGSPLPDEIVIALALTCSGRPFARTTGLQKNQIIGLDGNK